MAYKRFEEEDIVLSSENVVTPVWSNGKDTISVNEMQLDVNQTLNPLSSPYYSDVVYVDPATEKATDQIQFSIAYADASASLEDSKARVVYGQYRSLVLGDEMANFYFNDSEASEKFYIISVERARFKERIMLGSLRLEFDDLVLVDDSDTTKSVNYIDSGRVYNLVKEGDTASTRLHYGWLLPDIGVLLLDKEKCALPDDNREEFFGKIKSIRLGAEETVTSNYIFARARNAEFNYSINPSNIGEFGELKWDVMVNSPQVYITAVGLYNDAGDLLAVAKLSRPLLKDFTKEALIRIKLDY